MTGNKYLSINSNLDIQEMVSVQASSGGTDAGKIVALNSAGFIDSSMLPFVDTVEMTASEAISGGDFINIFLATTAKIRKANAGTPLRAHAFCNAPINSGSPGAIEMTGGINTGLSSLTIGAEYWLDTTAGLITKTPSLTTGQILQPLGVANSLTSLVVNIGHPIVRA